MFTKIIESILMKHVGKYLNEVQKNSFDVGLFNGDIVIENVGLNNKLFEQLGLPITLKFSNIDRLMIQVPWTKLEKEKTVVFLNGLNVLITMDDLSTNDSATGLAYKFNRVLYFLKKQLNSQEESKDKKKDISLEDDSFAMKALLRMLDNLEVNIHNIHLRFQDNKSFGDNQFSLGLLIDQINIRTTDMDKNNYFFTRTFNKKKKNDPMIKTVTVSPISVYWNEAQTNFIKEAVETGMSKSEIIWLMRAPFPNLQKTTNVQKSNSMAAESPAANFFNDIFKTRGTKSMKKESPTKQKTKEVTEWKFDFRKICVVSLDATIIMNDLKEKDTPILEIEANFVTFEVQCNQVVLSQLFFILQHFLKYATDLYFFQNRSLINNTSLDVANKLKFNAGINSILKKNKKVKKFQQLTDQSFSSVAQRSNFNEAMTSYSVKKLMKFSQDFVLELKVKKEIEKAREDKGSKEKSSKEIQKLMGKMKKEEDKDDEVVISTNRPIFQLKLTLPEINIVVDYLENAKRIDSLGLKTKGIYLQLRFTKEDELDSMFKLHDLILTYENRQNKTIFLNKNVLSHEQALISLLLSRKKKMTQVTGQIQRKILVISDQTLGFVLHFFEAIRINPFMLNLMMETTEFNIDKFNIFIKKLLQSLRQVKVDIRVFLPILQLSITPFHLVIDPGSVSLLMPGDDTIGLSLNNLCLKLNHNDEEYTLLSDVNVVSKIQRKVKGELTQDFFTIEADRIGIHTPPIHILDKLILQVLSFVSRTKASTSQLVVRQKILISNHVKFNNHLSVCRMYLFGECLQFQEHDSNRVYMLPLYKTRAYQLYHQNQEYILLVKKGHIDYIQLKNPDITVQKLNDIIERMSTVEQLSHLWVQIDQYEQNMELLKLQHNHHSFLSFIEDSQNNLRKNTLKLYEIHFILKQFSFRIKNLLLQAKRFKLRSIHHDHTKEQEISFNRLEILVADQHVIQLKGSNYSDDFMTFLYQKVITESCEFKLGEVAINLSIKLVGPIMHLLSQVIAMQMIKEAQKQTFQGPPIQFEAVRMFSLKRQEFNFQLKQIRTELFNAMGVINNIKATLVHQTSKIELNIIMDNMEFFDLLKLPSASINLQISEVFGVQISVECHSLVIEVNPTLFQKYLALLEPVANSVLENLQILGKIIQEVSILQSLAAKASGQVEILLRLHGVQILLVLNERHMLAICNDESFFKISHRNLEPTVQYTISIMRINIDRINDANEQDQIQITVVKPFSLTAIGSLNGRRLESAHVALTKLEIELNFELFEFVFMICQSYIVTFGKNPWVNKFLADLTQQQHINFQVKEALNIIELNTQIEQICLIYLRDSSAPFVKFSLKMPLRNLAFSKDSTTLTANLQLDLFHFNSHYKIYEPVLENCQVETKLSLLKKVMNTELSIQAIRIDVSKHLICDCLEVGQKVISFLSENRNRMLQVLFYLQQISEGKKISQQMIMSNEEKKHRYLMENIRVQQIVMRDDTIRQKKHLKNYIKISNKLGIDIDCELTYVHSLDKDKLFSIRNHDSHTIPIAIECEYRDNYQVLERLRKIKLAVAIRGQPAFQKTFTLATFLNETLNIAGRPDLPSFDIYLKSQAMEDEYVLEFTTARKLHNLTDCQLSVSFNEGQLEIWHSLMPNTFVFLPFFTKSSFYTTITHSKQVFLLDFSKSEEPIEICLNDSDNVKRHIIVHTVMENGLQVIKLLSALEIINHFTFYIDLSIGRKILVEPGVKTQTTEVSLFNGPFSIKFSIPGQTKEGTLEIEKPQRLYKERSMECSLENETITVYFLLQGPPEARLFHVYPKLEFINETPQNLYVFKAVFGGIFPIMKIVRDNCDEFRKLELNIADSVVKCRFKPIKTCYILDEERYLHVGLRKSKKGLSKQFVIYQSDFNRSVTIEDNNLIHKYCLKYRQTKLGPEISTFKCRLLPKFYLINRTQFQLYLFDDLRVQPQEMIVLPFSHEGNLLMDIESPSGKLFQIAPAQLFQGSTLKYHSRINLGFISKDVFQSEKSLYDQSEITKLQIQLIFHDSLGYYILNKHSNQFTIDNRLQNYSIRLRDFNGPNIIIQTSINKYSKKQIFPIFSQEVTMQITDKEDVVIFNNKINLNDASGLNIMLDAEDIPIEIKEYYEQNTRILLFSMIDEESDQDEPGQQNITDMTKIDIKMVVVSFILDDFQQRRKQILHLNLEDVHLTLLGYQSMRIGETKVSNIRVCSNQIQGNKDILKKDNKDQPFLNVFAQGTPTKKIVQSFKMEVSPMSIWVSDELIELLLRNVHSIMKNISFEQKATDENESFNQFFQLYSKQRQKLQQKTNSDTIRLVNFVISSILVRLTLKQVHFQGNKEFLKSFGFSFVDIDNSTLSLSELKIMNAQQSLTDFLSAIVTSYYNESLFLILGALGGMNIIGNPREFYMEIRQGVGQYNSGIIRGTGGLLQGVTAGAANAVSKIMGSIGNGIGSLSLDDTYLTERQIIKQRQVNGFMDGISSGGRSIYKGFESGITGLVKQPVQGMKEDGFVGAIKGGLKGIAGLFTKSLTGIIDATSKTAQGLTALSSLTKSIANHEQWYRPLYFQRNIIRHYDDVDEMSILYLRKFFPQDFTTLRLVKCFLLESQDPSTLTEILVIGLHQLIQINISNREVILNVPSEALSATAKFIEGVVLYYLNNEDEEEVVFRLQRDNDMKHLLYLTLQKLIDTYKSG